MLAAYFGCNSNMNVIFNSGFNQIVLEMAFARKNSKTAFLNEVSNATDLNGGRILDVYIVGDHRISVSDIVKGVESMTKEVNSLFVKFFSYANIKFPVIDLSKFGNDSHSLNTPGHFFLMEDAYTNLRVISDEINAKLIKKICTSESITVFSRTKQFSDLKLQSANARSISEILELYDDLLARVCTLFHILSLGLARGTEFIMTRIRSTSCNTRSLFIHSNLVLCINRDNKINSLIGRCTNAPRYACPSVSRFIILLIAFVKPAVLLLNQIQRRNTSIPAFDVSNFQDFLMVGSDLQQINVVDWRIKTFPTVLQTHLQKKITFQQFRHLHQLLLEQHVLGSRHEGISDPLSLQYMMTKLIELSSHSVDTAKNYGASDEDVNSHNYNSRDFTLALDVSQRYWELLKVVDSFPSVQLPNTKQVKKTFNFYEYFNTLNHLLTLLYQLSTDF